MHIAEGLESQFQIPGTPAGLVCGQEAHQAGQDPFPCVFKEVMSCVRIFLEFGIREEFPPLGQEMGAEAPIFHSPVDLHGEVLEGGKFLFDGSEGVPTGVVGIQGDVFDKPGGGDPVGVVVVRIDKALGNFLGESFFNGHGRCKSGKCVELADNELAVPRDFTNGNPQGDAFGTECRSVQNREGTDFVRVPGRPTETNRPTPVVDNEMDAIEFKFINQAIQIPDMVGQGVLVILGLVRETATDVVRGDAAETVARQLLDGITVEVGPCRVPVEEEHWLPFPMVDIIYPVPTGNGVGVLCEGVFCLQPIRDGMHPINIRLRTFGQNVPASPNKGVRRYGSFHGQRSPCRGRLRSPRPLPIRTGW